MVMIAAGTGPSAFLPVRLEDFLLSYITIFEK